MTRRSAAAAALLPILTILLIAAAAPALAQHGHGGTPPGLAKKKKSHSGSNAGSSADAAAPPGALAGGPAIRSLGVWLDDATTLGAGEAWVTLSMQRWASPSMTGVDAPVSDVTVGLTPRLQAFASLPFSRYGTPADAQLGDVYFGAKYAWREAGSDGIGVAISPAVEVLSEAAVVDTGLSRTNLVLPVSAEWRPGDLTRVYGSTGYFTRGAWFAGAALERSVGERLLLTGAATYTRSTASVEASTAWGLSPQRLDASGTATWIVTPRLAVFGGLARTLSQLDADSTRYAVSAGASFDLRSTNVSRPPVR